MPLRRIAGKRTAYIQIIMTSDQATSVTTGARIGLCIENLPHLRDGDWPLAGPEAKSAQAVETAPEMESDPPPAEESRMKLAWLALAAAATAATAAPLDSAPLPTRVT